MVKSSDLFIFVLWAMINEKARTKPVHCCIVLYCSHTYETETMLLYFKCNMRHPLWHFLQPIVQSVEPLITRPSACSDRGGGSLKDI